MTHKDLKGMPVTEMVKCQCCSGYHTLEESEVVIVRIIKGKACKLDEVEKVRTVATFTRPLVDMSDTDNVKYTPAVTITPKVISDFKPDPDGLGRHIPPKEMEENVKKRKSIIPSGLASMMLDPGSAEFESKGAKEVRRV